jgi:hypothetical protein
VTPCVCDVNVNAEAVSHDGVPRTVLHWVSGADRAANVNHVMTPVCVCARRCNIRCLENDSNKCVTQDTCFQHCIRDMVGLAFVKACEDGCVARCT